MSQEISIEIVETQKHCNNIKNLTSDFSYHRNELQAQVLGSGGDVYNEMFVINSDTEIAVGCTRQLMECTMRLLENITKEFKDVDEAIAKEVSML